MEKIIKCTIHERIQNTLISHLREISGSQLICFQIISHLTTRVGNQQVAISLDQFETLTGLSRKTVINSLKKLSSIRLIKINTKNIVNKYSVNRGMFQKLEKNGSKQEKIFKSIINEHHRVEKIHFEGVGFPLEEKKFFDLWNTYIYKWLDITDETHLKYVQRYLKTISIDSLLKATSEMINNIKLEEIIIDDSLLVEMFGFKGD